ncbi:MAG: hypothetical protein IPH66_03105 [Crocinitomicaceae bacterium]|nr:hypothetical protein [Crocinitomicaceae bacterium]
MPKKENLLHLFSTQKSIEFFYISFLVLLPFGAFFIPVSIGLMTLYPQLICLLLLCAVALMNFNKLEKGLSKRYLWFCLIWLGYALVFIPFVKSVPDAIIDIRSLIMMFLTSLGFVFVKNRSGFERWHQITLTLFKMIFFFIFVVSLFEMLAGIHMQGAFTTKIIERGIIDQLVYTPVFLLDNPNTVFVYLLLFGMLIIIMEPVSPAKKWLKWFILLACFIVSYVSFARIGNQICLFIALCMAVFDIVNYLKKKNLNTRYPLIFMIAVGAIVFIPMEKYYGPIWKFKETGKELDNMNEMISMSQISKQNKIEMNSNKIRVALIKNGLDYTLQSRLIGIGPGQFRYKERTNDKKYYTTTVEGPHFWFIEIVSQYGILIFLGYLFFLWMIFFNAVKQVKKDAEKSFYIILSLFVFCAISVMPSAFLILDINWIFILTLIILVSEYQSSKPITGIKV